jgi:hypothetical protein
MYGDYEKKMKKKGKKKETQVDDDASVNQGVGGDPHEPPSSPSSCISSSSEHSHHFHQSNHKTYFKKPLLKLDVKFSLPIFNGYVNPEKLNNFYLYNGYVNPEKLNNWIRHVEVYCLVQKIYWRVQEIDEEEVKPERSMVSI